MSFYWSVNSLPELRDVPAYLRTQVANKAIGRLRVTFFSGIAIIAFMLAGSAAGLATGITVGKFFALLVMLPFFSLVRPLLLNLARSQIREMLTSRSD